LDEDLGPSEKRALIISRTSQATETLDESEIPKTELEIVLRELWCRVIQGTHSVKPQNVGANHNSLFKAIERMYMAYLECDIS
jgi:hypothetical protein